MKTLARIIVLLALLILAVILYLGVEMVLRGYSAREAPSTLEVFLMRHARSLATPFAAKRMTNPAANSPDALKKGRGHWTEHCATCHGLDGSGSTDIGRNSYPQAPDMRQSATQELTDGELFYIIQNGVRFTGMPAWAGEHTPQETWHLVTFIRHLPQLTPQELDDMKKTKPEDSEEHEHVREHGAAR